MSVAPALLDPDWAHLRAQVRGMLARRLGSAADAEDVAQEVLLRVFRNTSTLRDGDRFGSWLAVMVRNAVADQLRDRLRNPVAGHDRAEEAEPAPRIDDRDDTARRRLVAALRPFAERLPAIYREAIILSELEEVPHAEIARRLSISISGVKSRVQRGREQLRHMLNDCCEIALDARGAVVACEPREAASADGCCGPSATGSAPQGSCRS